MTTLVAKPHSHLEQCRLPPDGPGLTASGASLHTEGVMVTIQK